MRDGFSKVLLERAARPEFVFLTGDLGFMALEELRDAMGPRFINAGVAEQNMVSVAAAMAREGLEVWVYSIAPFLYARPFEQIRNDVCMHDLSVRLVGNGGGYAYGVMGPTHHALEDYGILLTLPGMSAYVPAFGSDVGAVITRMGESKGPAYLRLGRDESLTDWEAPSYDGWRRLIEGSGPIVVVIGPIAGSVMFALSGLPPDLRPDVWVVTELPLRTATVPEAFVQRLEERPDLCIIEEHVSQGGLGAMLTLWIAKRGLPLRRCRHLSARGYPSGRYGSQAFHRRESGLDPESIRAAVLELSDS